MRLRIHRWLAVMIIIGIDPGSRITGYGIIENLDNRNRYLGSGVIDLRESTPLAERLLILDEKLHAILEKFQPDNGSLEAIFFAKNVKSALILGHARGVALLQLARHHLPIYEYTPLQVKQTLVGFGRASKEQVQHMVRILLNRPQIPMGDDESDALAIAITHAHFLPHLKRNDRFS